MQSELCASVGRALCVAVVALAPVVAVGQTAGDDEPIVGDETDPLALEAITVRAFPRQMRFYVKDLDARLSVAWRDDSGQVGRERGAAELTSGFRLTNRVVVQTKNAGLLQATAECFPGLAVQPLVPARGFWVLSTGSCREAAAIADALAVREGFDEVHVDLVRPRALRDVPSDPLFGQQWHLNNEQDPLFDVNAEAAWDLGYAGSGVVVGIVEDSWQRNHWDLAANYYTPASQGGGTVTGHATSCAGLVAEVANNDCMGAGVAYGAWISSQIFGSDAEDAAALAYRNDLNDIKSNSWGPPDIGMVAAMPPEVQAAIAEGVSTGRDGLGEVFVWAAGNGGGSGDRVDYDGYAASRFTIAVGAIGDADTFAVYNEKGSSMVVVAQSSGNDRRIATTTSGSGWTTSFGGTSAAAPLAAGVIALMLEANPGLTWRDVQHVLINSARKNDPDDVGWTTNAAGYDINYYYGFGAVDAGAAVALAEQWKNVAHEVVVDTGVVTVDLAIPDNDPNGVTLTESIPDNIHIETIELILNIRTPHVGHLRIELTGPSETESLLAKQRLGDYQDDYDDFVFTSFRHWGERSAGDWTIHVADWYLDQEAHWDDYRLILYGTPLWPGDLNNDGEISVWDLAMLLTAYKTCEGEPSFNPAADFDNTGCVDLADLGYLLSIYGESQS